jgi:hypothetical protein
MEDSKAYNVFSNLIRNKKNIDFINQCLIGTLLGDAHLQFSPSKVFTDLSKIPREGTTRYRFGQKYRHREYVKYVHSLVFPLCGSVQEPHPEVGSNFWHFYSEYLLEITRYHEIWYQYCFKDDGQKSYVKRLPKDLDKFFVNPLSLFLWYLDDGSLRKDCLAGRLATQCFSFEEHEFLREILRKNFQLETVLNKSGFSKGKIHGIQRYSLSIPAKSFKLFLDLTFPYRAKVPTMTYKFEKPRND